MCRPIHTRAEGHNYYAPGLREAHVFSHPTQDAAQMVTHELDHAVDHALGHRRAGVGETTLATSTHAPSQQPDFLGIYGRVYSASRSVPEAAVRARGPAPTRAALRPVLC